MDREIRKINLKKLQLPDTKKLSKCTGTNSVNITRTPTTIVSVSTYFQTPQKWCKGFSELQENNQCDSHNDMNELEDSLQKSAYHCNDDNDEKMSEHKSYMNKRTKLDAFVHGDPEQIISNKTPTKSPKDDDLVMATKSVKRAPRRKKLNVNTNKSTLIKKKKQCTIKTAFLRNERMFAEIAAQHCAAEQFDGDEIQLALALSKSEMNNYNGKNKNQNVEGTDDMENIDNIREKLKIYGFRTGSKKDYQTFAENFWSASNRRKRKCKWANKFTALTLRNPKLQNEKLQQKIECVLKQQKHYSKENHHNHPDSLTYNVISSLLRKYQGNVVGRNLVIKSTQAFKDDRLEDYFVQELFEINYTPCGRLLKDWSTIPGRSVSPIGRTTNSFNNKNMKKPEKSFKNLEDKYRNSQGNIPQAKNQVQKEDTVNELPDEILDLTQISSCSIHTEVTRNSLATQRYLSSPDLFADSDVEMSSDIVPQSLTVMGNNDREITNISDKSMEVLQNVTTYELFTSDDVKTLRAATTIQADNCKQPIQDTCRQSPQMELNVSNSLVESYTEKIAEEKFLSSDHKNNDPKRSSKCSIDLQDITELSDENDEEIFQRLRKKYLGDCVSQTQNIVQSIKEIGSSLPSAALSSMELNSNEFNLNEIKLTGSDFCKNIEKNDVFIGTTSVMAKNYCNMTKDDDIIVLSDDDVDYSIRQANNYLKSQSSEYIVRSRSLGEHSAYNKRANRYSINSDSEIDMVLSENLQKAGYSSSTDDFNLTFLNSPSEKAPIVKPQKCKEKFNIFLSNEDFSEVCPSSSLNNSNDNNFIELIDMHEYDRQLLHQNNIVNNEANNLPHGLNELLHGELKFSPLGTTESISRDKMDDNSKTQEIKIEDTVYTVRLDDAPKPDFTKLTDDELLKRLYNIGVKPLKRKHAIKLLEYIYNQTHPIIVMDDNTENSKNVSNISANSLGDNIYKTENFGKTSKENERQILRDGSGEEMFRSCMSPDMSPELINEVYILQTNITKKTPQPLVPLHIAWYNLICSNHHVYESILMYKPIDLQEIYIFLKNLGYRYDPKDMKRFFDSRCIIFRYDLGNDDGKTNTNSKERHGHNRHIRRAKSKS